MRYRGIVFDFNGVLLWDSDLQVKSWQALARELRGNEMTEEELVTHMHGWPNADVLRYLAARDLADGELRDLIQRKESLYRQLLLANPGQFVLSPGAQELIEALLLARVPRTIATSSEITNLNFFIQHLRLAQWFDVAKIVYDDGSRPGKPAPDVYLAAAENIHTEPGQCIVVEDAVAGLESANAAGIGCIIGLGGPAARARLLACQGVQLVIESLRDFPRALLLNQT